VRHEQGGRRDRQRHGRNPAEVHHDEAPNDNHLVDFDDHLVDVQPDPGEWYLRVNRLNDVSSSPDFNMAIDLR
jgi:hypothetical protein